MPIMGASYGRVNAPTGQSCAGFPDFAVLVLASLTLWH